MVLGKRIQAREERAAKQTRQARDRRVRAFMKDIAADHTLTPANRDLIKTIVKTYDEWMFE